MTIRRFIPTDREKIVALMLEFGRYLEKLDPMGRTNYAENGPEYFTDKLITDTKENQGAIFVAEEENHMVGFIGGYLAKQSEEELMETSPAIVGVISEFFVTEKSRSQGIGEKLLLVMEKYLKDQRCKFVRLEVFAPNVIARKFYAKHGYQDRSITVSKDL